MATHSPFRVSVADLLGEPGRRREIPIETQVDWSLELTRVGPAVSADLVLEAASGGIVVRGPIRTTMTNTCHRCLTEWEEPIEVSIIEVLGLDDDADGYPLEGDLADLEQPVLDAVLLAVPITPTCREGCLGLCSTCGADLNTGACPGHDEEPDSPFASLRGLLDT